MYTIRVCTASDHSKLIRFIDEHWKKDHALVLSKPLLDWQHLNGEIYNFIIAEHPDTGEFDALLGFISPAQYDPVLADQGDYWAAIWKVREGVEGATGLGLALVRRLFQFDNFRSYGISGISDMAQAMYKALKYELGHLAHYYIANRGCSKFSIAKSPIIPEAAPVPSGFTLAPVELDGLALEHGYAPKKTIPYLIQRYRNHPIYAYEFYGAYDPDQILRAVFVLRQQEACGSSCLRLIDVYGSLDGIGSLYDAWQALLEERNAEYVDCMNFGIDAGLFTAQGFEPLDHDGTDTIIPNYFEPFVQQNIKVRCAIKADGEYVFFKGDADQDRPNHIGVPA